MSRRSANASAGSVRTGRTRRPAPIRPVRPGGGLPKKRMFAPWAKIPGLVSIEGLLTLPGMTQAKALVPLIPGLMRRARRLTRSRDEAEDLVQETLLCVCQRLRENAGIEDLPAYTMRTLSNRARRHWRKTPTEELEDHMAIADPDAMVRLHCADTLNAVGRLPEQQRALMVHIIRGETSPARIAQTTGLPLGTVMSRLARARARLRAALRDETA